MTSPIERMRARAEAFNVLGLSESAAPGEIRAAWRRVAFEVHPDRTGGDYADFMRAKAAYELLRPDGEAGAPSSASATRGFRTGRSPTGARPRVATRRVTLGAESVEACRALLETGEAGEPVPEAAASAAGHVPDAVERHGRSLTYIVETELSKGINRVALPTALLEDNRRVKPRIVTVRAARSGAAEVRVPDRQRARLFPGARSVTIRFGQS